MTLIDRACWERGCACHDDRDKFDTVDVVQRTWVGLTDEEAQQTFAKHNCTISTHLAGILARAVEAKLKEKNT